MHGALLYVTLLHMTKHITSAVEVTLAFLCIQLMYEICCVILIGFLIPKEICVYCKRSNLTLM